MVYPISILSFDISWHRTAQALAQGQPKEWERRINLILYPRTESVNRTLPIQYPCYEKTRLSDYSFFHDGAACFGTSEYHTSWAKRELFRHFDVATKPYSPPFKPSELQAMYRVIAGRNKRYIDPASAEGVRITDDIAAANTIMGEARPQWKDARRQRGRKTNQSTAQPETRSTSNTTAAIPVPTVPRTVVSQRTTRITSNTSVPVPVALDSEVSTGLSTITAATVPPTQISRTVLRTRSAAVLVTPNSKMTWTQDKRGTLEVPIEIDDNLDQDQSMEDCRNNSTATEDPDSNEFHPEDSESDDWDDGHLTDNARDDIPSVDESPSNNIAPDIVHYTSGDDSVVEPTCRSNLASVLQTTSLFNESDLRSQQGDLASEGILMRQPYRSRKPSVQNVLPNPSSLKLPETNGPIIVEELMQLGERCQRITQKHEAIKGYLRALDEHLLLTMLGVEQLFDS